MNTKQDHSEFYNVPSFCADHSISRPFFYQLLKEGKGPEIIKLGRRTLISKEAAAKWRKNLQANSAIS